MQQSAHEILYFFFLHFTRNNRKTNRINCHTIFHSGVRRPTKPSRHRNEKQNKKLSRVSAASILIWHWSANAENHFFEDAQAHRTTKNEWIKTNHQMLWNSFFLLVCVCNQNATVELKIELKIKITQNFSNSKFREKKSSDFHDDICW